MSLTSNQIDTTIQSQLGRPATDYEISRFATASPQTLATLKDTYAKLNPNSISDYLTSVGQDNSLSARTALGQKYGITNIGTAEGNTALLNALKSGKAPTPVVQAPVTGSITPQNGTGTSQTGTSSTSTTQPLTGTVSGAVSPTPDPTLTSQGYQLIKGTDGTLTYFNQTTGDKILASADGSIPSQSSSSTTMPANDGTIDTNPDVVTAKNNYASYQKQVAGLDSQISAINTNMANTVNDIKKEVAQSGQYITESQAQQIAGERNAAMKVTLDSLVAQRKNAASYQSDAGKQLTAAQQNYYKSQTLAQGQEKIDAQSQQFTQKLEQAGWKSNKMNVYDQYGNVVGQQTVWTQNPANKTGFTADGQTVNITSGSQGVGITPSATSSTNSVPTTAPLTTSNTIDISSPGYTTATITYQGKDTQLTQAYIDQIAVAAIMNGGTVPSSVSRATKGLPLIQMNAIKARMGQLDPGGNLALNKTEAQAWGKTITTQIAYATTLNRSLQSADADLKQVIDTYKNTGINDSSIPLKNVWENYKKYNLGDGDVSAFKSSVAEIARIYSQVFSTGGTNTDTSRQTASSIVDGTISLDNLQKVTTQLQALGKIDVQKANDAVSEAEQSYRGIVPNTNTQNSTGGASIPRGSMSASDYVDKVLKSQNIKYDDFVKQVPQGKIAVIQNSDGTIGYVDTQDEVTSDYTPI